MLDRFRGTELTIQPSERESARFGLRVVRVVLPDRHLLRADTWAELLAEWDPDLAIVRYPAERTDLFAALITPGFAAIGAGTLMYWEGLTDRPAVPDGRDDVDVIALGAGDADTVTDLITAAFRGYRNHYSANPRLDPELVNVGYAEWALTTALDGEGRSFVLRRDHLPVGIATVAKDGDGSDASDRAWEIELAGIHPDHQNQGLYRHLLEGIRVEARRAGVARVFISTQSYNLGVQRAWARAGYRPVGAIDTVHVVRRP